MIELLPDHAVKSRPQPGALWFSIAVHIAAFSFGIWRYEGPFRYNATVHAAAPTTITWFEGRLTLPGAPTSKGSAVPEETKSIPSTTNHTANSLVQRNSPSDSVGHSAPLAWFGGLLDEEGDQANLHAALNYRRAGGDSVGGLLSGMNGKAETGLALPPPPPPIAETKSDPPAAPATPEPPIRIGGHLEPAEIVKKTFPKYPPVAMQARVEGTVVLEATIGEDGKLHDIKVISGHPLLIGAATECIRNWRYRPAVLNGEIISSPATIEVRFIIQRSKSL